MPKFIAYYRVSTRMQGRSGLGLQAQEESVAHYINSVGGTLLEGHTEIESGRNPNRPVLRQTIARCKQTGATLLIAKLDRLSRNVAFLFNLKDELERAGISFAATDIPDINNTLVLGVMATMAQHEAEIISQRTKAGIRQSKVYKSDRWGKNYDNINLDVWQAGQEAIRQNAYTNENSRKAFHFIQPRREKGMSYQRISDLLNAEGYRTRHNKEFKPATVRRLYLRYSKTSGEV